MCEVVSIVIAMWLNSGLVETVVVEDCSYLDSYKATTVESRQPVEIVGYNKRDLIYIIEGVYDEQ